MEKLESQKGAKALYVQIRDIYRRRILDGDLQPGDKIESETQIQKMYGVSRITARQAILDLEKDGMVNRGRGRGTFVIWKPAVTEELTGIRGFSEEMQLHGRQPGTSSWHASMRHCPKQLVSAFGLDPEQEAYIVERVCTSDDIRLAYIVSCFPRQSFSYLGGSVYEETGTPVRIEEELLAQLPDDEVVTNLNIPRTLPVLVRRRVGFDRQGKIMEYSLAYYRSDLYSWSRSQ
ncbi:GntR family transcriptional regulator [uncultured Faecalibaculum sp.]|nr:GntR family transcriptional regulator [uncultured Faecalibaculum sp.]